MVSNLYYRYFLEEYRPRYVVISKTKKKRYIAIPISAPTFPRHNGKEDNNNTDDVDNDDSSVIVGNKNNISRSHSSSNCYGVRAQHDNNNAVFLGLQRWRRQIKEQFVIGSLEVVSKPQRQDDTPQSYTITKAATRSTLTTTVSESLSSTTSIVEEDATIAAAAAAAAAASVGHGANESEKNQQQQQQPTSKKIVPPSSLPLAASPTTLLAPRIEKYEDVLWPLPKPLDDDDDDDDHNTANAKTNDSKSNDTNNNNQKKKNDGADELFLSFFQCCRSVI